jgi:hypothetical protein
VRKVEKKVPANYVMVGTFLLTEVTQLIEKYKGFKPLVQGDFQFKCIRLVINRKPSQAGDTPVPDLVGGQVGFPT